MGDKIVGLDLDGVVYDYHHALFVHYKSFYDYSVDYNTFWTITWNSLPVKVQDYLVSIPVVYEAVKPSVDDIRTLWKINDEIGEIFYITGRPSDLYLVTHRFLRRNDFPNPDNLVFSMNKGVQCLMLGVDYYVDDMKYNVVDAGKVCKSFLFARTHNRKDREGVDVVHSLDELYSILRGAVNNESI